MYIRAMSRQSYNIQGNCRILPGIGRRLVTHVVGAQQERGACLRGPASVALRAAVAVTQLCPTLCNRMDCSTPGFPVLPYLPEFAQIHIHRVGDDRIV